MNVKNVKRLCQLLEQSAKFMRRSHRIIRKPLYLLDRTEDLWEKLEKSPFLGPGLFLFFPPISYPRCIKAMIEVPLMMTTMLTIATLADLFETLQEEIENKTNQTQS